MVLTTLVKPDPRDIFPRLINSEVGQRLTRVSNFLASHDITAYVIGGLVRDVLLGKKTADIDLAIAANALEVAPQIANVLGGKYVPLDKVNGIGRVVLTAEETPADRTFWELDISTFEGSIEQDLARRDFTIDAMAIDLGRLVSDPSHARVIDPFHGRDDLQRGVVRAVTETVFILDAARLLRAVRLAAELGFIIDKETETLIQRDSQLISGVAGERVREELLWLLAIPGAGQLTYLDELGLLTRLFPELASTRGVQQPKEHHWDVFQHSLNTVAAVDFLLRLEAGQYASREALAAVPWSAALAEHFNQEVSHGSTRRLLLKLAALLHDISKPQTKMVDTHGRTRFLGHANEGAAVATGMLERLRFSTREIQLVAAVIEHHLRPTQLSQAGLPSHRAVYRYFRDTGEAAIDTLFLSLADHLAARGPDLDLSNWQEHANMVKYMLTRLFEPMGMAHPPKLVDGHDIINIFGISPGPRVGEVLEAVREAQASGEIKNREEALAFINMGLSQNQPPEPGGTEGKE